MANPFKPGDRALHRSGRLDSRVVVDVDGGTIRLRIGNLVSDPVQAANYHRIPKEDDHG